MHAYLAEVISKAWFHERSCCCIKRSPFTVAEHSLNDRGNAGNISCCVCFWLSALFAHERVFCFIFVTRNRGFYVSQTHHLPGNLIRFLFIDIPRLVDFEFRLWHCCLPGVNWYPAKVVAEA